MGTWPWKWPKWNQTIASVGVKCHVGKAHFWLTCTCNVWISQCTPSSLPPSEWAINIGCNPSHWPTEILEVYKSLQFKIALKFELPPSARFFFWGGTLTLQWTKNEIESCHMGPTEKLPLMPASVLPQGMGPRACSSHSWPAISGCSKLCWAHQSEMRPFGNHSSLEASCIWTVAMSKCGHWNITTHPECCTVWSASANLGPLKPEAAEPPAQAFCHRVSMRRSIYPSTAPTKRVNEASCNAKRPSQHQRFVCGSLWFY